LTFKLGVFPSETGTINNPRSGGNCAVDPNGNIAETDETNNACSDSVNVTLASTVYTDPGGVCSNNTPCFTSITDAINNVSPSGTIEVGPGDYSENVSMGITATMNIDGDITIISLILTNGTMNGKSSKITLTDAWEYDGGTFNANTGTVSFNGSSAVVPQNISGGLVTTFNNLVINNNGSKGVAQSSDEIVNGLLTLTTDLDTSSFTLTMSGTATSAGTGDVTGKRKNAWGSFPVDQRSVSVIRSTLFRSTAGQHPPMSRLH